MSSPSRPAVPNSSANRRELMWSRSEKAIPHKAFDAALERELQEMIQEAKRRASEIQQPSDLWDLEHYLIERRNEIDRKYDYRYSQLDLVFGRLRREGWLDEEDLRGLGEDKLQAIRSYAKFFAVDVDPSRSQPAAKLPLMNENPTEREYSLLLAALRVRLRILAGYWAVFNN